MPPAPQRAPMKAKPAPSKFIIFDDFSQGMNTQSVREGLNEKAAAWLENLQPIAANNLAVVPAPAPPMAMLPATVARKFYAFFNGQTYSINFLSNGALWAIPVTGGIGSPAMAGTPVQIAPVGTFSATGGDVVTWTGTRLLMTDSLAGYCTWDGSLFVNQGCVSPNVTVSAGGSGYANGTFNSTATGSVSGAANAVIQMTVENGAITSAQLTNPGSGYVSGDTLTLTYPSGGSSGTVTAHVWPFVSPNAVTITVGFGRVVLAAARTFILTGTGSSTWGDAYDDFQTADDSVTTTIGDADLITAITAVRFLEAYIYILGDNSVKFIGSISGTTFTITPLSSDQGTTFLQSVLSYNRLVIFANTTGVFAVFGSSVEKISGPMDGIFKYLDFSQPLQCAVNDLNNIHVLLVLVKYSFQTQRSLILGYFDRKWFVLNQGNSIRAIATMFLGEHATTFASSTTDETQILEAETAINIKLQTTLTAHGNPIRDKRVIRLGTGMTVTGIPGLTFTSDTERNSVNTGIAPPVAGLTLVNNSGQPLTLVNNTGGVLQLVGSGFALAHSAEFSNTGRFVGVTVTGTLLPDPSSIQALYIEYQDGAMWGTG